MSFKAATAAWGQAHADATHAFRHGPVGENPELILRVDYTLCVLRAIGARLSGRDPASTIDTVCLALRHDMSAPRNQALRSFALAAAMEAKP